MLASGLAVQGVKFSQQPTTSDTERYQAVLLHCFTQCGLVLELLCLLLCWFVPPPGWHPCCVGMVRGPVPPDRVCAPDLVVGLSHAHTPGATALLPPSGGWPGGYGHAGGGGTVLLLASVVPLPWSVALDVLGAGFASSPPLPWWLVGGWCAATCTLGWCQTTCVAGQVPQLVALHPTGSTTTGQQHGWPTHNTPAGG